MALEADLHPRPIRDGAEFVMFDIVVAVRAQRSDFLEMEFMGHINIHDIELKALCIHLLEDCLMAADTVGVDPFRVGGEIFRDDLFLVCVTFRAPDRVGMDVGMDQKIFTPHLVMTGQAEILSRCGISLKRKDEQGRDTQHNQSSEDHFP
jgi:hypothetical protein